MPFCVGLSSARGLLLLLLLLPSQQRESLLTGVLFPVSCCGSALLIFGAVGSRRAAGSGGGAKDRRGPAGLATAASALFNALPSPFGMWPGRPFIGEHRESLAASSPC